MRLIASLLFSIVTLAALSSAPAAAAHLFRCTPSPTAREVRIEATDPWGACYTETWRSGTA